MKKQKTTKNNNTYRNKISKNWSEKYQKIYIV